LRNTHPLCELERLWEQDKLQWAITLAYKKAGIHPIRFPGDALTSVQRSKAEWLNF